MMALNNKICYGTSRNKKPCASVPVIGSQYCGRHKYMIDYTAEMLANLKKCKDCKKMMYLGDNVRCDECNENHVIIIKCKGTDRKGIAYINMPVNNTAFCNFHKYMILYTEEMMEQIKSCTGCHMQKYMGEYNTCEGCRNHGKENRIEDRKHHIKCKYYICSDKKSDENDYCGKHKRQQWIDDVIAMGKNLAKVILGNVEIF